MAARAALYARVSTKDQADNGTSLDTQEAALAQAALKAGYSFTDELIFKEDYSGYYLERPKLDKIRELAREGKIQVLLCYALDRLSRDQVHQTVLYYELEQQYGVKIELVSEKLDDTPEGQFLRSALGFMAQKEREKILERTSRGKRERARRGNILPGGLPIYGLMWEGDKKQRYKVDNEAAEIVMFVYSEAAHMRTCSQIAEELNRRGVLSRLAYFQAKFGLSQGRTAAAKWSAAHVAALLRNPVYKGVKSAFQFEQKVTRVKTPTGSMKIARSVQKRTNKDMLVALEVPALVSEEVWNEAQKMLARHRMDRRSRGSSEGIGLLRGGFAICAYCGSNLVVGCGKMGHKVPIHYYTCGNSSRGAGGRSGGTFKKCPGGAYMLVAHKLDEEVWAELAYFVEHSGSLLKAYEKTLDARDTTSERDNSTIRSLEAAVEREQKKRANFLRAIANADDPEDIEDFTAEREACTRKIREYQAEIERVKGVIKNHQAYKAQLEKVATYLRMARSVMELSSYEEKRMFLYALGVQVKCYRGDDLRENGTRFETSFHFGGEVLYSTVLATA